MRNKKTQKLTVEEINAKIIMYQALIEEEELAGDDLAQQNIQNYNMLIAKLQSQLPI